MHLPEPGIWSSGPGMGSLTHCAGPGTEPEYQDSSHCATAGTLAGHFITLRIVSYVNCLIYLVCSVAHHHSHPRLLGTLRHNWPHDADLAAAGSPGLNATASLHTLHLSMVYTARKLARDDILIPQLIRPMYSISHITPQIKHKQHDRFNSNRSPGSLPPTSSPHPNTTTTHCSNTPNPFLTC